MVNKIILLFIFEVMNVLFYYIFWFYTHN